MDRTEKWLVGISVAVFAAVMLVTAAILGAFDAANEACRAAGYEEATMDGFFSDYGCLPDAVSIPLIYVATPVE